LHSPNSAPEIVWKARQNHILDILASRVPVSMRGPQVVRPQRAPPWCGMPVSHSAGGPRLGPWQSTVSSPSKPPSPASMRRVFISQQSRVRQGLQQCRSLYRDVEGLLADEADLRLSDESLQVNLVQWYPGHIARAERQLKDQLSKVDILLQVGSALVNACNSKVAARLRSECEGSM